jgi:hypothetical protein
MSTKVVTADDLRPGDHVVAVGDEAVDFKVLTVHTHTHTRGGGVTIDLYTTRDPWPNIYLDAEELVTITVNDPVPVVQHQELTWQERQRWGRDSQWRWWYHPPGSQTGYLVTGEGSKERLLPKKDWRKLPPVSTGFHRIPDDPETGNRMCACNKCGKEMTTLSIGYHRQNTGH